MAGGIKIIQTRTFSQKLSLIPEWKISRFLTFFSGYFEAVHSFEVVFDILFLSFMGYVGYNLADVRF